MSIEHKSIEIVGLCISKCKYAHDTEHLTVTLRETQYYYCLISRDNVQYLWVS